MSFSLLFRPVRPLLPETMMKRTEGVEPGLQKAVLGGGYSPWLAEEDLWRPLGEKLEKRPF